MLTSKERVKTMTKKVGFTQKDIARDSGLEPRQVQFFTDTKVVTPGHVAHGGRGRRWRRYSIDNLREFRLIRILTHWGMTYSMIEKLLEHIRQEKEWKEWQGKNGEVFLRMMDAEYRIDFLTSDNAEDLHLNMGGCLHALVINLTRLFENLPEERGDDE